MFIKKAGFTLIELMVVISIIGILSALGTVSFNSSQGKARDTKRKNDLKELQKALQTYYQDNTSYPNTSLTYYSSEPGNVWTNNGGDWIPGLAPKYIPTLPRDPKGGATTLPCAAGALRGYLYISDGNNYKLMSHCAGEGSFVETDPFIDPVRTNRTWQVSTPGGINW